VTGSGDKQTAIVQLITNWAIRGKLMRIVSLGSVLAVLLSPIWARSADDKPAKPADAPALELELRGASLETVDDKAGRWQFVGGKVMQNGQHVANYASVKRVVKGGTDDQNTAMLTTTIFFLGSKPPENLTLQGAHDFNSGEQIGSVSAASAQYSAYVGKPFSSKRNKLVIK
jgi:hypothetical protein